MCRSSKKKWIQNVFHNNVKIFLKIGTPSNEEFKSKMHKKIPNTKNFDLKFSKVHDFFHFYNLQSFSH
jgi:hypothetical protein